MNGTNTIVALLICHGSNVGQLQMEFFVKRDGQCILVLGPTWRNLSANAIPEFNEILPGFVFDCELIASNLPNN